MAPRKKPMTAATTGGGKKKKRTPGRDRELEELLHQQIGKRFTPDGIEFVACDEVGNYAEGSTDDAADVQAVHEADARAAQIATSSNNCNDVEMNEQNDQEVTEENSENSDTGHNDDGTEGVENKGASNDDTGKDNTGNDGDVGKDSGLFKLKQKIAKLKRNNKKLKSQLKKLGEEKAESDNLVIRLMKKLNKMKDKKNIGQLEFTQEPGVEITKDEVKHINTISATDSVFAGNLAVRLIGADKLRNLSVTGKACARFSKLKNADGTPKYPARERLDPKIFTFICVKIGERAAMQIGPENMATIILRAMEKRVREYLATKINNLRTAQNRRDVN